MKDYQIIENNIDIELGEINNNIEEVKKDKDKMYYLHKIISKTLVSGIIIPNIYLIYIMLF
jgi:hypothetical protein